MKKLVIEVMYTPWCNLIRIKEQTHVGINFGHNTQPDKYVASNGFILVSNNYPDISCGALCVRGLHTAFDRKVMMCPDSEWLNMLKVAVREYNETFMGPVTERSREELIIQEIR